jgi:hypothetical protein
MYTKLKLIECLAKLEVKNKEEPHIYLNIDSKIIKLASVRLDGVIEDGAEVTAIILTGTS